LRVGSPVSPPYLCHRAACVLPCIGENAARDASCLDNSCYYIASITLEQIISREFIDANIRQNGEFSAISASPRDHTCTVSVYKGVLTLDLDPANHEIFGCIGERRKRRGAARFRIQAELTAPSFTEGHAMHDRLQWCAKGRTRGFDLVMSRAVEGRSVKVWVPAGVHCDERVLTARSGLLATRSPILTQHPAAGSAEWCSLGYALAEWVGLVLLAHPTGEDPERHLSDFDLQLELAEQPMEELQLRTAEWAGMIAASQVSSCIADVVKAVQSGQVPWGVIVTWGFNNDQDNTRISHQCGKPHTLHSIVKQENGAPQHSVFEFP